MSHVKWDNSRKSTQKQRTIVSQWIVRSKQRTTKLQVVFLYQKLISIYKDKAKRLSDLLGLVDKTKMQKYKEQ